MSKITYVDKVALNDNPNVNAINKVRDIDMNEIKEVVNDNETKILLAVVDTAPAQCSTGDMYFNTTSKKIFIATGTDTWGNTGEDPTENTLYVVISTQTTYIYDGDTLVSVGGGTGSSDIIMVDPDTPVQDTKLYIESTDLDFQGLEISNTYTTGDNVAYSADYVNGIIESGSNANGNYVKYADGTMICYTSITGTANLSNSWGSLYYAEISTIINFPQEFTAVPNVHITAIPTGSSAFWVGSNATPVITVSSYKNVALIRPTSASNVAYQINLVAIGKWK